MGRSIAALFFALSFFLGRSVAASEETWIKGFHTENYNRYSPTSPTKPQRGICPSVFLELSHAAGVTDYLNRYPVIRVGVTHAPGFGHQMSSIHIVNRLRQLGYDGELEIIYEKYSERKIAVLLREFDPEGPAVQRIEESKLTLISREEFDRGKYAEAGLAFQGAEDEVAYSVPMQGRPSKPETFRSRILVRLQPANWIEGEQSISSIDGYHESLQDLRHLQHLILSLPVSDVTEFLKSEIKDAQDSPRFQNLKALLSEPAAFELGAFYNAHTSQVYSAWRYGQGIELAMRKAPQLFVRGVVIPILSEMSSYSEGMLIGLVESEYQAKVIRLDDPKLAASLPTDSKKILFVVASGLPPNVIQLFFQRATLPAAVAGKYSNNQMKMLGNPYFDVVHDELTSSFPEGSAYRFLLSDALSEASPDRDNPSNPFERPPSNIAKLVILSRSVEGEELRQIFRRRAEVNDPLKEDKVFQAIQRVMRVP